MLPLDIRSLGYRARAAACGSADAALSGVQRFSAATARPRVARVLPPVAALGLVEVCSAFVGDFRAKFASPLFYGLFAVPRAPVRRSLDFLTRGDGSILDSRVLPITNSGGVLSQMPPSAVEIWIIGKK